MRNGDEAIKQLNGLLDAAKQEYAGKKFAEALRTCDRILELDPGNSFAQRYLARIHTLNGDVDRAEGLWRHLYATARNKVEPAMHLARFAQKREQWDEATEFADLVLREDPERLEALRMAIHARVRSENFAALFDLLPLLYAKEPERALGFLQNLENPEPLPALAAAFIKTVETTKSGEALEVLKRGLLTVWLVAARRAMAGREGRLAGSYLRTVLAIDPSSREAVDGLDILSRESLFNLRRAINRCDRQTALYYAEITSEINPTLVEAWFCLARLIEQDDPGRSVEFFRTCVRLMPQEVYYRVRLGRSLRKSDKVDEALMTFERAHASLTAAPDPRSAEIVAAIAELRPQVFSRGKELLNEGRLKEAWAHFLAATAQSPVRAAMCLAAALFRSKLVLFLPGFKK